MIHWIKKLFDDVTPEERLAHDLDEIFERHDQEDYQQLRSTLVNRIRPLIIAHSGHPEPRTHVTLPAPQS